MPIPTAKRSSIRAAARSVTGVTSSARAATSACALDGPAVHRWRGLVEAAAGRPHLGTELQSWPADGGAPNDAARRSQLRPRGWMPTSIMTAATISSSRSTPASPASSAQSAGPGPPTPSRPKRSSPTACPSPSYGKRGVLITHFNSQVRFYASRSGNTRSSTPSTPPPSKAASFPTTLTATASPILRRQLLDEEPRRPRPSRGGSSRSTSTTKRPVPPDARLAALARQTPSLGGERADTDARIAQFDPPPDVKQLWNEHGLAPRGNPQSRYRESRSARRHLHRRPPKVVPWETPARRTTSAVPDNHLARQRATTSYRRSRPAGVDCIQPPQISIVPAHPIVPPRRKQIDTKLSSSTSTPCGTCGGNSIACPAWTTPPPHRPDEAERSPTDHRQLIVLMTVYGHLRTLSSSPAARPSISACGQPAGSVPRSAPRGISTGTRTNRRS